MCVTAFTFMSQSFTPRRFAHPTSASASSSTRVCVYFQSNNCRYGDACRYSHQIDHVEENGHHDPDYPSQQPHYDKQVVGCRYWLNGQHCKFGDSCRYEHKPEQFGLMAPEHQVTLPPRSNSWNPTTMRDTTPIVGLGQNRKSSNLWVQNRPRLGSVDDANWRVRQPSITQVISEPQPPASPLTQQAGYKPCRFWMQSGTCKFGNSCRFAHTQPNDASQAQVEDKPVVTSASLLHKEFRKEHRPTFSSTSWDDIMDAEDGGMTPEQMNELLKEWNAQQQHQQQQQQQLQEIPE